MKYRILVIILSLFFFSCNSEKETVINLSEYYAQNELDEKTMLLNSNESNDNLKSKLGNEKEFELQLLVNEKGNVDKILINKGSDLNNLELIEKLRFKAGVKYKKSVKSIYILENYPSEYFVKVDEMPFPIGGIRSIAEKIKYPKDAKRMGIQGKVLIRALVNEQGLVDSVEVLQEIGYGCEEAAIDAVKKVKFTPGKKNGENIKSQVVIPINFKLQ